MAKYNTAMTAGLRLDEIPKHIALERYSYRLKVTTPEAKKSFDSGVRAFDKNRQTIKVNLTYDTAEVIVEIYLDGKKEGKNIRLQHFDKNNSKFNVISLKSVLAKNSSDENHVVKVNVKQADEVGWLLVKREQTFDSLLKWVYKRVPTHTQLDIFRHANSHLSDLQDLSLNKLVKPGQIILISNKKSSPELNEYKKLALDAERIYQILCKDKNFDPIFFANNYELLMDYYSLSVQVAKAKLEYRKTVEGHKEEYCESLNLNVPYEATNAAAIYSEKTKPKFDEVKIQRVQANLIKELNINLEKLQKEYALEAKNNTRLASDKHFDKFRKEKYIYFQKVEGLLAKNFTQLHDNKEYAKTLKNIVKDTSGVRSAKFQGGLKLSVARMHAIGSTTISLKMGGKIIFYLSAIEGVGNIYKASQTGNVDYTLKVAGVESITLFGGAAAGVAGAAAGSGTGFVIGVGLAPFTAGVSIPVLSVVGAVAGGVYGGFKGAFLINEESKKILGICG